MRVCYWASQFFRKVDGSFEKSRTVEETWSVLCHGTFRKWGWRSAMSFDRGRARSFTPRANGFLSLPCGRNRTDGKNFLDLSLAGMMRRMHASANAAT
jgi:hypothetical protein